MMAAAEAVQVAIRVLIVVWWAELIGTTIIFTDDGWIKNRRDSIVFRDWRSWAEYCTKATARHAARGPRDAETNNKRRKTL